MGGMHWGVCAVAADFSGEQVVQRHMSRLGRDLLYHRIQAASTAADREVLELVLQEYGMLLTC